MDQPARLDQPRREGRRRASGRLASGSRRAQRTPAPWIHQELPAARRRNRGARLQGQGRVESRQWLERYYARRQKTVPGLVGNRLAGRQEGREVALASYISFAKPVASVGDSEFAIGGDAGLDPVALAICRLFQIGDHV